MLALGILFLILAAVLVVAVIWTGTSQEIVFHSFAGDWHTHPVWVFVAGAVAMLLVALGLSCFGRGTKSRVARRREMNRLRRLEREHVNEPDAAVARDRERGRDEQQESTQVRRTSVSERESRDASAAGYDEPDRRLVRETRQEHVDLRPAESTETADAGDAARHRDA